MATARTRHRNKQYAELVEGNTKLHKDIEDLETAYMIHKHYVEQDENSVKGLIRKEIGGSRWEHGGSGKLYAYKSSKDLVEKEQGSNQGKPDRHQSSRQGASNVKPTNSSDGNKQKSNVDLDIIGSDLDQGRLIDLKTKVLKKASSKIIHRKTWRKEVNLSPETNTDINRHTLVKNDEKANETAINPSDKSKVKKNYSAKHERIKAEVRKTHETTKVQKQKQIKQDHNLQVNSTETVRKSRRDSFESKPKHSSNNRDIIKTEKVTSVKDGSSDNTQVYPGINGVESGKVPDKDNVRSNGKTYTPRKLETLLGSGPGEGIFPTQPVELTEIFIDPASGQVRVTAGQDERFDEFNLMPGDNTRVLIQPSSPKKSFDGTKFPCTIVDRDESPEIHSEVRDVFGFATLTNRGNDSYTTSRSVLAKSPFAAAKQCNTEVEFWLRGLGIPDVDRYVRIFAQNDVDLTDLEFMSASQLHDMGINTFGALDKILKGIRDMKIKHPPKNKKSLDRKKPLDASCIAWENGEGNMSPTQEISVDHRNDTLVSTDRTNKSCQRNNYQTYVKHSLSCDTSRSKDSNFRVRSDSAEFNGIGGLIASYEPVRRCGSAMSNVSSSTDLGSRTDSKHPSYSSSTQSSSAKCVDKRPPSAKMIVGGKSANQKLGSRAGSSTSSQKAGPPQNKLRRSNSFTAPDRQSKLASLEERPTKGALIRPRSSSLTRESTRNPSGKNVKEQKKVIQNSRTRSRSADAVKRKALEGVQAAARKFEERSHVSKESDTAARQVREERKKQRRDEMAARHLQRERIKEINEPHSSDTDENSPKSNQDPVDTNEGLESLVTVNILSPPKSDPKKTSLVEADSKTSDETRRVDVRKSLRRLEQTHKQNHTAVKPIELQMPSSIDPPLLATYKLCGRDREKCQSEPESGYKTDGSTTYSQIEDRVSDIQLKIKRLKARATNGDEMTLTLVRDLQTQLQHFEKQLIETNSGKKKKRTSDVGSQSAPETENVLSARSVASSNNMDNPISDEYVTNTTPIEGPDEQRTDLQENLNPPEAKAEAACETKKEKPQPNSPFKPVQNELQKYHRVDPVSSMELDPKDIAFKKEDVIGEGTFSRVYKGEYQGSEVAIKQLRCPLQSQDRNYFAAEVSLLKELRHPRVVLLIGVCTSGNLPLMVLELMSRGSLYNYLHNPDCESLDHALYYQVARDIAQGMNYLHSHKPQVLHLDLTSMNVLLCESLRAKIADFGFSKLRHEAGSKSKGAGKIRQKPPSWMSPELLDKGEITCKSDVYSFGIILWEMIARKVPYEGVSIFRILEMVRKKERPEIPKGTPEGLHYLISLCWDQNPAKRPQFKEILQMLENLAFPPAWRELFQKAGVPDSALQDVKSTRTIISLVSGTLDSEDNGILHSFMISQSKTGNQSTRSDTGFRSSNKSKQKLSAREKQKSVPDRLEKQSHCKTGSSRNSLRVEEAWEAETVTTISGRLSNDDSDFTLKDLGVSSSDSADPTDESTESSSEDETYIKRYLKRADSPRKRINVFVPNLELSLQSARDEFRAERQRIAKDTDWTSISLDDRTTRSSASSQDFNSTLTKDDSLNFDTKLRLSTALSSRSATPVKETLNNSLSANESARSRRRDKCKDITRYSEEFMRESYDNLRPPSPKKRNSLTKKLMESSCKSSSEFSQGAAASKEFVKAETLVPDDTPQCRSLHVSKQKEWIHESQDSFFGLSNRNDIRREEKETSRSITREPKDMLKEQVSRNQSTNKPEAGQSVGNKSEGKKLTRDSVGTKVSERNKITEERLNVKTDIKEVLENVASESVFSSGNKLAKTQTSFEKTLATYLKENPNNKSQTPKSPLPTQNGELDKTEVRMSSSDVNSTEKRSSLTRSDRKLNFINVDHSSLPKHLETHTSLTMPDKTESEKEHVTGEAMTNDFNLLLDDLENSDANSTNVETSLNELKLPEAVHLKLENSSSYVELQDNSILSSRSVEEKDKIRVKLNIEDVEKKKKPTITPRRSKLVNKSGNGSDKVPEREKGDLPIRVSLKMMESQILNNSVSEVNRDVTEKDKRRNTSVKENSVSSIADNKIHSPEKDNKSQKNLSSETVSSPKKRTISVKLRKDPLASTKEPSHRPTRQSASPIPPAPPPPPVPSVSNSVTMVTRSVQESAPRTSMADELKSRLAVRQSISEGVRIPDRHQQSRSTGPVPGSRQPRKQPLAAASMSVAMPSEGLGDISETDEKLVPKQSEGLPAFMVQSMELKDQKDQLRSISKPHPHQLDDLSNASQEQLSSIADILKKAVMNRRLALGEDGDSVTQSMESVATGWSIDA